MLNIVNIVWLKMLDLMQGSLFFRTINNFLEFIAKICKNSFIVSFFTSEVKKETINQNIVSKFVLKFFKCIECINKKFFSIAYQNSFFGKTLNKINLSDWLVGSVFFNFLTNLFGISYCNVTILDIGLLIIIFLAPFVPTMFLAVLVIGLAMLFLLKLLIQNNNLKNNKNVRIYLDLTAIFILIFIFITIFFGITSLAPTSSMKIAFLTSTFMLFYLLAISIINTREKIELVIFTLATSSLFVGIYGLYQQFSGFKDTRWVDKTLFDGLKLRVYSTFENPNVYGEYLLLIIPLCLAMVCFSKKTFAKIYYFSVFTVLVANLGLTYSRGCYIALLLSIFVAILLIEKKLIVFFSIGIFALPFILPASVINRVISITNFSDSSTSYRIMIWQSTIMALKDFWYVGLGQGNEAFNKIYPMYSFNSVTAPHSHSVYLQVLVETGLVGFLAFLTFIICFFKTQFSKLVVLKKHINNKIENLKYVVDKKEVKVNFIMIVAFISAIIAFLIQGFFDYVFYNYRVFLLFFIVLAIANAFVK